MFLILLFKNFLTFLKIVKIVFRLILKIYKISGKKYIVLTKRHLFNVMMKMVIKFIVDYMKSCFLLL